MSLETATYFVIGLFLVLSAVIIALLFVGFKMQQRRIDENYLASCKMNNEIPVALLERIPANRKNQSSRWPKHRETTSQPPHFVRRIEEDFL